MFAHSSVKVKRKILKKGLGLKFKNLGKSKAHYVQCPYSKEECKAYNKNTGALLIASCKECSEYDHGVVASKF
jgi:hypothetical protein